MNEEQLIQAAARVVMKAALELIQADPHQWSSRPCATCRAITAIAGEPFGCIKVAQTKKDQ